METSVDERSPIRQGAGCGARVISIFGALLVLLAFPAFFVAWRQYSAGEATWWMAAAVGAMLMIVGAGVWRLGSRASETIPGGRPRATVPTFDPGGGARPSETDWADGRIECTTKTSVLVAWFFAAVWNALVWPVPYFLGERMWHEFQGGEQLVGFLLLFPLVGLGLLWWAVKSTLAWWRFGTSVFVMSSVPGVIGGPLQGQVHTRLKKRPEVPFQATLSAVRTKTHHTTNTSGGSTTSSRREVVWQGGDEIQPGELAQGPVGLAVPIDFHVPYGLPETGSPRPDESVTWVLEVYGDIPGIDFSAGFEVPVFVTEESRRESKDERRDRLAGAKAFDPSMARVVGFRDPVTIRQAPGGGTEYVFRPEAPKGQVAAITLMGLVFVGLLVAVFAFGWHGCFAWVAGSIAFILLLTSAIYLAFSSRVVVDGGAIKVRKVLLGIGGSKEVSCASVERVEVSQVLEEGGNKKPRHKSWEISLRLRGEDEPYDVGAMFTDKRYAEWVAARLEEEIVESRGPVREESLEDEEEEEEEGEA